MESKAACPPASVAGRVWMHTPSLHVQGWLHQRPGRVVAVAAGQEARAQSSSRQADQSAIERRKARVSRMHEREQHSPISSSSSGGSRNTNQVDRQTSSSSSSNGSKGGGRDGGDTVASGAPPTSSSSSSGTLQPSPTASQPSTSSSATTSSAAAVPRTTSRVQQGTPVGAAGARDPEPAPPARQRSSRADPAPRQQQQQQQQPPSRVAASKPYSSPSGKQAASTAAAAAAAAPSRSGQALPAAAAAGRGPRRIKEYAPVFKGDLQLPGGPHWSSLRRHIAAAGADPTLPTLDHLIIVEGDQDQRAVARAANAPVYVCDGTRVLRDHVRPELDALPRLGRTLVVLTDPDERGRELRNFLDTVLGPGLLHAFIPEREATSTADTGAHEAGNRGIEHVVPRGVQLALQAARESFPGDRCEFTVQELQEQRLVNAWNAGSSSSGTEAAAGGGEGEGDRVVEEGAAQRRRRLCALLGLGRCQGNQLLDMLNRYVTRQRFQEVLSELQAGMGPAGAAAAADGAAAQ